MRKLPLLLLTLLLLPSIAHAQAWSGIVDPTRAVDWSGAGIPGGVPSGSWASCVTAACNTLWNSGVDGAQVTAANINAAVTSALANTVVRIPGNGTTRAMTGGISGKSNVAIRGQGANQTILQFSGTAGCGYQASVCLAPSTIPSPGDEKNVCNWTAGYAKGATTITLASCGAATPALGAIGNLKVGSLLMLDQIDDSDTDNGGIWICATQNVCGNTVPGGGQRTNGGTVAGITNRSQQQTVTVASCDGNSTAGHVCASGTNITITPGLYMPNWRSGQLPQAWFASTYMFSAGIENVTLNDCTGTVTQDGSGNFTCSASSSPQAVVVLAACSGCWVQGVRSMWAPRAHVTIDAAAHSEVRDSYFYQSQSHASVSYTVEILWAGSDNKVENNISQQVTDSMPNCNGGCEGNVFSYNFAIDDVWVQSSGWMQASFYQHASGDTFNLWEGNIGPGYTADQVHGTHTFETIFRNRLVGNQTAGCGSAGVNTCANQTIPVHLYAGSRYFNVIGNVLGQAGYHNNYTALGAATSAPNGDTSIYTLGASGNGGNPFSALSSYCLSPSCATHGDFDPQVSAYLMRWGNYSTFTQASDTPTNSGVRFVSTEIPSALATFANAVPASQTLPASFYLSSRPAWFGSVPYPAIGPDVTGGNLANLAGHANMTPAMACFTGAMAGPANGTGAVLSFNASTCYAAAATLPVGCGNSLLYDETDCGAGAVTSYTTIDPVITVANGTQITGCGFVFTSSTNYFLAGNIGSNNAVNCLTITGLSNVKVDLGGFTVTGAVALTTSSGRNQNVHIYHGGISCSLSGGTSNSCLNINNNQVTTVAGAFKFHHLTIQNVFDSGTNNVTSTGTPFAIGGDFGHNTLTGDTFELYFQYNTVLLTNNNYASGRTGAVQIIGGLAPLRFSNNLITIGGGEATSQGIVCYGCVSGSQIDNNVANLALSLYSSPNVSSRAFMFDASQGTSVNPLEIAFNDVVTNDHRCVRVRDSDFPYVHDNYCRGARFGGASGSNNGTLGAIHMGDPDSFPSTAITNIACAAIATAVDGCTITLSGTQNWVGHEGDVITISAVTPVTLQETVTVTTGNPSTPNTVKYASNNAANSNVSSSGAVTFVYSNAMNGLVLNNTFQLDCTVNKGAIVFADRASTGNVFNLTTITTNGDCGTGFTGALYKRYLNAAKDNFTIKNTTLLNPLGGASYPLLATSGGPSGVLQQFGFFCSTLGANGTTDGDLGWSVATSCPGAALATLSQTVAAFFNQMAGTTTSLPTLVTLTNNGGAPLTISGFTLTGTNAAEFNQTNNCGTGLGAAASCVISITFSPSALGPRSATLGVNDNAAGSPHTVSLSGNGMKTISGTGTITGTGTVKIQ